MSQMDEFAKEVTENILGLAQDQEMSALSGQWLTATLILRYYYEHKLQISGAPDGYLRRIH